MHDQFEVNTGARQQLLEITDQVAEQARRSAVNSGLCFVYCPHTTAGLTINENADPDVRCDILHALDRLVPLRDPAYRHAEGNSAAHVKASMVGFTVTIPIISGRLALGTWQGIYLCEFDGPRRRTVRIMVQAGE